MEERKIYRGNFVNFMTGKVDKTLARGSEYSLKIVEKEKEYFYHVQDNTSACNSIPFSFTTCVITDWAFLNMYVQNHHILTMYPYSYDSFISEQRGPAKDLSYLYNWADQFSDVLPREIILKMYEELGYQFKEVQHRRTFKMLLSNRFYSVVPYQIEEFKIDSEWHIYIGRESTLSTSFRYNIKQRHVVVREEKEFRKNCGDLKSEFPNISYRLTRLLLQSCFNDVNLCRNILSDILKTRELLSTHPISTLDELYMENLEKPGYSLKSLGFKHFIHDWNQISNFFAGYNQSVKNELSNFMLGR